MLVTYRSRKIYYQTHVHGVLSFETPYEPFAHARRASRPLTGVYSFLKVAVDALALETNKFRHGQLQIFHTFMLCSTIEMLICIWLTTSGFITYA
jgi:hypothetical protein